MFFVMLVIYKLVYDQLVSMVKLEIDEVMGEILDGGFDMKIGGLCSYMYDLFYIISFL